MKKDEIARKIAKEMQMPENASHGFFRIELNSNREVAVEGCRGLLEYSETKISVNLGNMVASFNGDELEIGSFFEEQAHIKGNIMSVEFSS